jgi:hypothetical protein
MNEVAGIGSNAQAATWARGVLAAKNTLTTLDAQCLEQAFEQKLVTFPDSDEPEDMPDPDPAGPAASAHPPPRSEPEAGDAKGIDKSVLAIATPRRHRNKAHLRHVAQQACLVCGRKPSDPHQLRFTQPRSLGRKVSDEFTVPLCRGHHRAAHRSGDETAWWQQIGVDPIKVSRKLWRQTRRNDAPRVPAFSSRTTLQLDPRPINGSRPRS